MDSHEKFKPVKLYYSLYVPDNHDPHLSPIIFLHGTGALHTSWNRVNIKIANQTRRKTYCVDLRNHGKSEWSEHNTLHDYEADLDNFLEENEIAKCVLIGHSLGGKIAMFFAMKKPQLVEKIVTEEIKVSNPSKDELKDGLEILESAKKLSKLPKDIDEETIRELFSKLIAEKYPTQREFASYIPLRRNYDGSFELDFNLDVIVRTFTDRTAFEINFKECKKFTGPVLALYAGTSPMKVEEDVKIKEFFPNAELCEFKTCAHVLHVDRPDEFVKNVSNFVNK